MDPLFPALGLGLAPALLALTLHALWAVADFLQELSHAASLE